MPQKDSHFGRRLWFVLLLALLLFGMGGYATYDALHSVKITARQNLMHKLDTQARSGAIDIAVWVDRLREHVERLSRTDLIRLYAAEMDTAVQSDVTIITPVPSPNASPDAGAAIILRTTPLEELTSRAPAIAEQLHSLINFTAVESVRVLNRAALDILPMETNPTPLTVPQRKAMQAVFDSGTVVIAPLRNTSEGLMLDMLYPLFAPEYLGDTDKRVVAVLMAHANMKPRLEEVQRGMPPDENRLLALVQDDGTLVELRSNGVLRPLIGWERLDDELPDGRLPLAERSLEESQVYALGVDVPGIPAMLVQTLHKYTVEKNLADQKFQILLKGGTSTALLMVLLVWFWWWLVGRRDRAVAKEVKQLYETVDEQKQMLTSIDNTLPGGVVFTNTGGIIRHANRSFAAICGHSPKSLPGLSLPFLFQGEARAVMVKSLKLVLETGQEISERMQIQPRAVCAQGGSPDQAAESTPEASSTRHFIVVCTPFLDAADTVNGVVSVFRDVTAEIEEQERNRRRLDQIVAVLRRAIEAVDPYLRGQSAFTGYLADSLAQIMDLSEPDQETVHSAAQLFQIGLIQVPRHILNKEEALTPEERVILEQHVQRARDVLREMEFDLPVLEAVCQMFERLDGTGYPDHLRDGQIDIHGRILAVANTLCALMRPRAYRNAKSAAEALRILSASTPPAYDPAVVDVLRRFLQSTAGKRFLERLVIVPEGVAQEGKQ